MMLISLGAILLAWVAFIWLYDPDDFQTPRDGKRMRYY